MLLSSPLGSQTAKPQCNYDYDLIAKVVYGEARGESFLGRKAVVDVVKNRMNGCKISSKEVIMRQGWNKATKKYEYAFEGIKVKVSDKKLFTQIKEEVILYLSQDDITNGAKYFYSGSVKPYWVGSRTYIKTIEGHYFYR